MALNNQIFKEQKVKTLESIKIKTSPCKYETTHGIIGGFLRRNITAQREWNDIFSLGRKTC